MYAHTKSCQQVFIAALVTIVKNWKHPRCLFIYIPFNTAQQLKGRNYWYTQQFGWISRKLCWMKCQSLKVMYCVSIYRTLLKFKILINGKQIRDCQWIRMGKVCVCRREEERGMCTYKRGPGEMTVVMELFCILTTAL